MTANYPRSIFFTIGIVVWIALLFYIGIVAYKNYISDPLEVQQTANHTGLVLHPGQVIRLENTSKQNESCHVSFTRLLRGGPITQHELVIQSGSFEIVGNGKLRDIPIDLTIPLGTIAGDYTVVSRYRFSCNIVDVIFGRTKDVVLAKFSVIK